MKPEPENFSRMKHSRHHIHSFSVGSDSCFHAPDSINFSAQRVPIIFIIDLANLTATVKSLASKQSEVVKSTGMLTIP